MACSKILIIIVTWNKEEYVLSLLKSIENLVYQKECIDILLVDNASQDDTVLKVSQSFPDVNLICNEDNIGGTGGFNTGLEWAFGQPDGKYDYFWLLDNDVVVNRWALIELVELLENNKDAAIAGSSMMQLDYPWRINEIGSYFNRNKGELILNSHGFSIESWKGRSFDGLLADQLDLSDYIPDFRPYIDVDYVAAASLLIRAEIAKESGLWNDFFIHFDDVEWCLRIAEKGYRVLASCRSLIWHMSSVNKIPTWVLYYDCRNVLVVMKQYANSSKKIDDFVNRMLKISLYYALIGRMELARLVVMAIDDFFTGFLGKREIKLPPLQSHLKQEIEELPFMDPKVKSVLVPWTVNLYATDLQTLLIKVRKKRPELKIDFLSMPGGDEVPQLPSAEFISFPAGRIFRYFKYWQLRNKYDLVVQSEYQRLIGLSWLGSKIMFLSNTEYHLSPPNNFKTILKFGFQIILKRVKGEL